MHRINFAILDIDLRKNSLFTLSFGCGVVNQITILFDQPYLLSQWLGNVSQILSKKILVPYDFPL